MRTKALAMLGVAGLAAATAAVALAGRESEWRQLEPGIEYQTFRLSTLPLIGSGLLHAVRIDPALVDLDLGLASEDGAPHRAGEWAARKHWSVAFNAGMYETDIRSNVGYLKHGTHLNNPRWKATYESVLALDGPDGGAAMFDRDSAEFDGGIGAYRSVVQNLRTVKAPGLNVWKPNGRMWTEATVAQDQAGRLLFLFTGTRFEQADFNDRILALPLGIVRAMHVEGGPEASLSIHTKALTIDLNGSARVGGEQAGDQWEIPNVIGVRARSR